MQELREIRNVLEYDMKVSEELMNDSSADAARHYYQGRANGLRSAIRFVIYMINVSQQQQEAI